MFCFLVEPSGAPTNLKVTVISGYVLKVSWSGIPRDKWNGQLTGYDICSTKKKTVCDGGTVGISSSSTNSNFEIKQLTPYTDYTLAVRAVNGVGEGPWSTAVEQRTPGPRKLYDVYTLAWHLSNCLTKATEGILKHLIAKILLYF